MTENEIARQIVDVAYKIHTTLGPGLLESAYEAMFTYEYLRLADKRLGLLVNFGAPLIKDGIKRVVNRLPE